MPTVEFKCLMPTAIPPKPRCKQQCKTCELTEIKRDLASAQARYDHYYRELDETPS